VVAGIEVPLTCRPAVSPTTGSDLGGLPDSVDTGQTGVGNHWACPDASDQMNC